MSSRIAALEDELGVLLLDRSDKQFRLTVAGIRARRSAMLPPPSDGAAHSGSGLGHQCCSTPRCTAASAAPDSAASAAAANAQRAARRGSAKASRPSAIATRYGQRSHRHRAQGTRPSQRSDASAPPSAAADARIVTQAAPRASDRIVAAVATSARSARWASRP